MPFGLDPSRQYDVAPDGTPSTDDSAPPAWLGRRHRLVLGLFAVGLLMVGGLAGVSVAAFASGARGWAAIFALGSLAAAPLLALGPVQDWWRQGRGHRIRHRVRPRW